jgi:hypothetical protein
MVRGEDARKLVEKTRAQRLEQEQRRIEVEAVSRAYNAQSQRVYEEALRVARAEQHQAQAEAIKRIEGHHGVVSYTVRSS